MENLSWKPAVYLIDGSNFYMSIFYGEYSLDRDSAEKKFADWVKFAAENIEELASSYLRVYMDGKFRNLSPNTRNVAFIFSDFDSADERLFEYAAYCVLEKRRVIAVSNDVELACRLMEAGVKTLGCSKFFRAVERKLK